MLMARRGMMGLAAAAPPAALEHVETKATQDRSAAALHTWSVAMARASGANRALVTAAGIEGTNTLDAASYNGVVGDLEGSVADVEANTNACYVWSWKGASLPGDTSVHDMVLTPSASQSLAAVVVEYDGLSDAAAESVDTSDVDPPDDMSVTSSEGALVFHAIVTGAGQANNFAPDHSQNERADLDAGNASIGLGVFDLIGVSAGPVTSGITVSIVGGRCAQVALSLARAA